MPCSGFSLHHVQLWGLKHFFGLEALECGQGEHPLAMAMPSFCGREPLSWPRPLAMTASYCHGCVPKQWLLQHVSMSWDMECQAMLLPYTVLGAKLGKAQWCLATDIVQSHSSGVVAFQHPNQVPGVFLSQCPN